MRAWYRRGIAIGAGFQVGLWKYRLHTFLLGVYLLAIAPRLILGTWADAWLSLAAVWLAHRVTGLILFRRW